MFTIFYFLIMLLFNYRRKTIFLILIVFYLFSMIGALISGNVYNFSNFTETYNLVFTLLIITIIILPFKYYPILKGIESIERSRIKNLTIVLFTVGLFAFIVNVFLIVTVLTSGITDYEAFKNTSLGTNFRYSLNMSHIFITLASFLSASGYFMIPLSIYYMYRKKGTLALACFILSLNIPIQGFTMFSRSWAIHYMLLLLFYLIYTYTLFENKRRFVLLVMIIVLLLPIINMISDITQVRFKNYNIRHESLISEPILHSIIDYFSQWNFNGIYVLSNYYSSESVQFAMSSNTFLRSIFQIFGFEIHSYYNLYEARSAIWDPPFNYSFNGLVAELVFDFGYILTFIIALIFYKLVKLNAPGKSITSFHSFLMLSLLVSIPVFSFSGNILSVMHFNIALVMGLIISQYLRHQKKFD